MTKLIILGALFAGLGTVHFGDRFFPDAESAVNNWCGIAGCAHHVVGTASVGHMFVAMGTD